MAHVKLNVSLDQNVASLLRRQAAESGQPISQFLGSLIEQFEARRQEALAEEGYRALGSDNLSFASSADPLSREVWSDW